MTPSGTLYDCTGHLHDAQRVVCRRLTTSNDPTAALDRGYIKSIVDMTRDDVLIAGDEHLNKPTDLAKLHEISDVVLDFNPKLRFGFYNAGRPVTGAPVYDSWDECQRQIEVYRGLVSKCSFVVLSGYWYPSHNWTGYGSNMYGEGSMLAEFGKPLLYFFFPGYASDTDPNRAKPLPDLLLTKIVTSAKRLGMNPCAYGAESVLPGGNWAKVVGDCFP